MATRLGTAFDCLQLFEGPGLVRLGVGEVASRAGVSRSTASVTLAALAEEEYLLREGEGSALLYSMGPRFQRAFAQAILREVQRLRDLRDATTRAVDEALGHFGIAAAILDHTDLEAGRRGDARPDSPPLTDDDEGMCDVDPWLDPPPPAAHHEPMPDGAGMAPTHIPTEQFDGEHHGRPQSAPECGATGGGCS